jgi:hypothetical protein
VELLGNLHHGARVTHFRFLCNGTFGGIELRGS